MRARAGDPPRNMSQKVFAGHSDESTEVGEINQLRVDHIILAKDPESVLDLAIQHGLEECVVETAIVYDAHCIESETSSKRQRQLPPVAVKKGILVARPGIGFPASVHLERFGSPARLAITDEPRLASLGGSSLLTFATSASMLARALITGTIELRPPRTVQILLSGKLRPFVCVRDVALELMRRDLAQVIEKIDRANQAPVVLEFSGTSARALSVTERAVLCSLAPQLGAASAVFVSDEKTEVYLRDQRRSKAHRSLVPDPGAPCDQVISLDLSVVDPLILDEHGAVRPVRELAGRTIRQVVLGGDVGASLRDLLATASLLKSKRVPAHLDFLIAPPSRQALEVLAQSGALASLIATGARLVEPDARILSGELYPPLENGASLRTYDPEPTLSGGNQFLVSSAETLAYAVASGEIGDPRSFKRPVRITVPRALPTDDVLIMRKAPEEEAPWESTPPSSLERPNWDVQTTLTLLKHPAALLEISLDPASQALLAKDIATTRWVIRNALKFKTPLAAIIAPHMPIGSLHILSGLGIVALTAEPSVIDQLAEAESIQVPALASFDRENQQVSVVANDSKLELRWLALIAERQWLVGGGAAQTARTPDTQPRP